MDAKFKPAIDSLIAFIRRNDNSISIDRYYTWFEAYKYAWNSLLSDAFTTDGGTFANTLIYENVLGVTYNHTIMRYTPEWYAETRIYVVKHGHIVFE